jgi:hypothetical protein
MSQQLWQNVAAGPVKVGDSNLCLDVEGEGTADNTRVILWPCTGGWSQDWDFDATFNTFRPRHATDMCLTVAGGEKSEGSLLVIYRCPPDGGPVTHSGMWHPCKLATTYAKCKPVCETPQCAVITDTPLLYFVECSLRQQQPDRAPKRAVEPDPVLWHVGLFVEVCWGYCIVFCTTCAVRGIVHERIYRQPLHPMLQGRMAETLSRHMLTRCDGSGNCFDMFNA